MFNDYGKVKRMLNGSFEEIQRLMNERELSYDEIKDLMVKALYQVKVEDAKSKVVVKTVEAPQMLYAPPQFMREEVKVEHVEMPQMLYAPPQFMGGETKTVHVEMPQMLYAPPQINREEISSMLDDEFIPGTNVRKPRPRNSSETDEEYLEYLDKYYGSYFQDNKGPKAR